MTIKRSEHEYVLLESQVLLEPGPAMLPVGKASIALTQTDLLQVNNPKISQNISKRYVLHIFEGVPLRSCSSNPLRTWAHPPQRSLFLYHFQPPTPTDQQKASLVEAPIGMFCELQLPLQLPLHVKQPS